MNEKVVSIHSGEFNAKSIKELIKQQNIDCVLNESTTRIQLMEEYEKLLKISRLNNEEVLAEAFHDILVQGSIQPPEL